MKLSREQVKHVAKLAELPLSDQEVELFSQQLSQILDYIEQLNQVDTSSVDPTFNVSPIQKVIQEDQPQQGLTQHEAISNAHQTQDGYFVTKGIFIEE